MSTFPGPGYFAKVNRDVAVVGAVGVLLGTLAAILVDSFFPRVNDVILTIGLVVVVAFYAVFVPVVVFVVAGLVTWGVRTLIGRVVVLIAHVVYWAGRAACLLGRWGES